MLEFALSNNGLPAIAMPRFIYHNAPDRMTSPIGSGWRIIFPSELDKAYTDGLRKTCLIAIFESGYRADAYLKNAAYIFLAKGFKNENGERWFVSYCDGKSFVNADFSRDNSGEWSVVRPNYVMKGIEWHKKEECGKGYGDFENEMLFSGRCEITGFDSHEVGRGVSDAIANWKPDWKTMQFPRRIEHWDPIFVPGLRYRVLVLPYADISPYTKQKIRYVALQDDDGWLHRFADHELDLEENTEEFWV